MITNVLFNNYDSTGEQQLLEDLVIESIQIYGIDCYYIARANTGNMDKVYAEDVTQRFTQAWMIECYLKNVMGFQGDRDFMSKIAGLEIRDQVIFSMSRRVFAEEIGNELNTSRPREADLLFFPLVNKAFEIMYVNQYEMHFQLGKVYTWELTCELFEYSSEQFNTGIPEIDALQTKYSLNIVDYILKDTDGGAILDTDGNYILLEGYNIQTIDSSADNDAVKTEGDDYVDWSETDPFSDNTEHEI